MNLQKRCNIYKIRFQRVKPEYSSFIGNILYRDLNKPDPILSSIEIGRRGYEFVQQYILKTKEKTKNIVFPSIEKFNERILKSLEEFKIQESFKSWIEMFSWFKKNSEGYRFRVPINLDIGWFEFKSRHSDVRMLGLNII